MPPQEIILDFASARRRVEEQARTLAAPAVESVPLEMAAGRVLAEDLLADREFPPFHRSARDGYALRAADVASVPTRLRYAGQIKAGQHFTGALSPGDCVEIMTGAPLPKDADAVVMVEHTRREGDRVTVERAVAFGENFVPAGTEARRGQTVLASGTRIAYPQVGVAASIGCEQLKVFRRPRVAILPTGDEIVEVGVQPGPDQIRNSNAWSLAAQVEAAGGEALRLPIAPDETQRLRELIAKGLEADLLLLSGGVSKGEFDLVEPVLAGFGAEFFFTGALIQPGKPVVFGRVKNPKPAYFFGLPGNPVSTMVTFELFVRPVMDALAGAPPAPLRFSSARLKSEVRTKGGLTRFLPARLSGGPDSPQVEKLAWQGSGDLFATSQANCWLVVPPGQERFPAGGSMTILLL